MFDWMNIGNENKEEKLILMRNQVFGCYVGIDAVKICHLITTGKFIKTGTWDVVCSTLITYIG